SPPLTLCSMLPESGNTMLRARMHECSASIVQPCQGVPSGFAPPRAARAGKLPYPTGGCFLGDAWMRGGGWSGRWGRWWRRRGRRDGYGSWIGYGGGRIRRGSGGRWRRRRCVWRGSGWRGSWTRLRSWRGDEVGGADRDGGVYDDAAGAVCGDELSWGGAGVGVAEQ